MKKLILVMAIALIASLSGGATATKVSAVTCTQTGYFRDGINLTAAQIGGDVTGTLDATGCHIGVYYGPGDSGVVSHADIYGASYFGVVARQAAVDVLHSSVHDIGDSPNFTGSQHGVAIYFATVNATTSLCEAGTTTGRIVGNKVWRYQKNGITANCDGTSVEIRNNVVAGADLSSTTAANSIQLGWSAYGVIENNLVGGNQWCGVSAYAATAILLVPAGDGSVIRHNNVRGNSDVGIYGWGDDLTIDNNRVFDDGEDCNANSYDYGIGNWGTGNVVTNNKVRGFDTPYDGVTDGKNKVIPGPNNGP